MYVETYLSKSDLEAILKDKITPLELTKVISAYEMSEIAHHSLISNYGIPRFYHTTRVCKILIYELDIVDQDIIISSLLHNILKISKEITLSIIDFNFGSYVAYLIQVLSEEYSSRFDNKTMPQDFNHGDTEALIIMLADCLDVLRSMDFGTLYNPFDYMQRIHDRFIVLSSQQGYAENASLTYLFNELKKERNKLLG